MTVRFSEIMFKWNIKLFQANNSPITTQLLNKTKCYPSKKKGHNLPSALCSCTSFLTSDSVGFCPRARRTSPIWDTGILPSPLWNKENETINRFESREWNNKQISINQWNSTQIWIKRMKQKTDWNRGSLFVCLLVRLSFSCFIQRELF